LSTNLWIFSLKTSYSETFLDVLLFRSNLLFNVYNVILRLIQTYSSNSLIEWQFCRNYRWMIIENVSSFISNLTSTMAAVGNDCFPFDKYEEKKCWRKLLVCFNQTFTGITNYNFMAYNLVIKKSIMYESNFCFSFTLKLKNLFIRKYFAF
jgi:hypothetical protein